MTYMKHLLIQTPNSTDGVSRYRAYGPLLELQRENFIRIYSMSEDPKHISNWQYYCGKDLVYIARSAQLFDLAFVDQCRWHKVPIWYDLDDNLFCVPDTSEAYYYYSQPKVHESIHTIMKAAKVITVTTGPLMRLLKKQGYDPVLIPNALEDRFVSLKQNFNNNRKVAWRGSGGGKEAVDYYAPAIIDVVKEFKSFEFGFFGFNPYVITRRVPPGRVKWERANDFTPYIWGFTGYNPSFSFLTHLDTEFDRNKSTNGWIESTLAGAVCLVPDVGDWSDLSSEFVFKYKIMDLNHFREMFQVMLKTPERDLREMHNKSWEYIDKNLRLSKINELRKKLILETINK